MTTRARWALGFGSAGLAAGLALGITGFATAASPSPSPSQGQQHLTRPDQRGPFGGFGHHRFAMHGYVGLVSAVSADTLTLRTPRGTEKISLTSSTAYYDGRTKASKSIVAVGDLVHVRLVDPRAAKPVAAVVSVVPAHLAGFVTAVGDDSITIKDLSGFTRTIRTSAGTAYVKDGATSTRSAITVGSLVRAIGTVDADGITLDATRVATGRPDHTELPEPPDGSALDGPSDAPDMGSADGPVA